MTHCDRPAAKKARIAIQKFTNSMKTNIYYRPNKPIDPALAAAAYKFDCIAPSRLTPPILDPNRPQIDHHNIYVFAEFGAQDLWASALSSTRFEGPRTSSPFRELYRLTNPRFDDTSDWAENIRWAKQQFQLYGSTTWLEYDDHLSRITEHRRNTYWASEEAILFG